MINDQIEGGEEGQDAICDIRSKYCVLCCFSILKIIVWSVSGLFAKSSMRLGSNYTFIRLYIV